MADVHVAFAPITALGCGLSARALFAFSSFLMGALAQVPAAQWIVALGDDEPAFVACEYARLSPRWVRHVISRTPIGLLPPRSPRE